MKEYGVSGRLEEDPGAEAIHIHPSAEEDHGVHLKAQKSWLHNLKNRPVKKLYQRGEERMREVRGTCERWRKGRRREGWRRRGKQVHSTNVGRQGQSREHLFLESLNSALHPSSSSWPPLFFNHCISLSLLFILCGGLQAARVSPTERENQGLLPEDSDNGEQRQKGCSYFSTAQGQSGLLCLIAEGYKNIEVLLQRGPEK